MVTRTMTRGHIRIGRAYGEAYQKKILEAAGVTVFYKDEPEAAAKSCRKDVPLYVVGLRGLGSSEAKILAALKILHDNGAAAIDAASGRRSDGRDGAELMREAAIDLRNERLGGHAAAKRDGAKGGDKAAENRREKKTPLETARAHWFDKTLTTPQALEKINSYGYRDEWLHGALYRSLGRREAMPGRIPASGRKAQIAAGGPNRGKRGYVYFMRIGGKGPVKIGFTMDLYKRLQSHKTSNHAELKMIAVMHGTKKTEAAMHKKYVALLIPGKREWFKMTEPLKSFIAALPKLDD